MTIQEIQHEITQLPLPNLQELFNWFEEYQATLWDRRIENDLAAGRLDALLAEVDVEYEAGLAQPL